MKKRVLFSGVGNSDPYRDDYDGSLLHIVRHYKPEKIYIYFTKEMYAKEKKYNEIKRSIKALKNDVEIICFPQDGKFIEDAHLYDVYINEFKKIIEQIVKENKDAEILFNISSGTPALKNTILLLSLIDKNIDNRSIKTIQVKSHNKGSNVKIKFTEIDSNTDIEKIVTEELIDNLPEAENRCIEEDYQLLKKEFIAVRIISLIRRYQYLSANFLIKKNENLFSKRAVLLIEHLKNRSLLNIQEADKILLELNLNNFIIVDSRLKKMLEFLNVIKINHENQSYFQTLIMIGSLIELILSDIAYFKYNFNEEDILNNGIINLDLVSNKYPQYFNLFNKYYEKGKKNYIKDYHYVNIIKTDKSRLTKNNEELLSFYEKNKELRNKVAHEVDINFYNKINFEHIKDLINEIEKNIKEIYQNKYNKNYEDIYDRLNDILIKELWF